MRTDGFADGRRKMNEYEIKLANVKKSCDVARKVAMVLSILMGLLTAFALLCGLVMIFIRGDLNRNVNVEEVGGRLIAHVCDENGVEQFSVEPTSIYGKHSLVRVSGIKEKLIGKGLVAEAYGADMIYSAIGAAIATGIFIIIMNVFKLIQNSDTPFCVDVMKRIKTVFIIITVFAFFNDGIGSAVLTGAVFWSVYCILDYGYVLQKESDETL